jgi:hypothetical protein
MRVEPQHALIFTEVFALEVSLDVSCVETGEGVEPFVHEVRSRVPKPVRD